MKDLSNAIDRLKEMCKHNLYKIPPFAISDILKVCEEYEKLRDIAHIPPKMVVQTKQPSVAGPSTLISATDPCDSCNDYKKCDIRKRPYRYQPKIVEMMKNGTCFWWRKKPWWKL